MRRAGIFLAAAGAVLVALPVLAGVVTIPQEDPRSISWESGGDAQLVAAGDEFYLVDHHFDCDGDGSSDTEVCIWGPVNLDSMHDAEPYGRIPDLPLIWTYDGDVPHDWAVVASVRDGNVQVALVAADSVVTTVIPLDGGATVAFSTEPPCAGEAAFDTDRDWLWFACGPTALDFRTGGLLIYAEGDQLTIPRPGGGAVGVSGTPEPTIRFFSETSGDVFALPSLPSDATMLGAVADESRGVGLFFRTPCADPCDQDPPVPADIETDPSDLVDFWVTWVGWDGAVEDGFGLVPVGTGPPESPTDDGGGTVATDGGALAVSHPARQIGLAPDASASIWRLVDEDGSLRSPFSGSGNVTLDLQPAWGGLLHLSFIDGVADLTFWHLSDQGRFFDDSGQFEDEIEALAEAGITLGCNPEGTLFCPEDSVSRAQMASFIARWRDLPLDRPDAFTDDDGSVHEASINAVADAGISLGCSAADPTLFCPDDLVSRAQMASFLARALGLPDDFSNRYTDDDGSVHELAIDAIATAGITFGCDVAQPDLYCPDDDVLRQQMAAFLVRAGLES